MPGKICHSKEGIDEAGFELTASSKITKITAIKDLIMIRSMMNVQVGRIAMGSISFEPCPNSGISTLNMTQRDKLHTKG